MCKHDKLLQLVMTVNLGAVIIRKMMETLQHEMLTFDDN